MKNTNFYIFAIALFFLGSCNKEEEQIPAFVHVKPFILTSFSGQGTSNSKFTDAWVSSLTNGDFLGAYEASSTFPLLESGLTKLVIEPGIKINGISATPDRYPMVDRFEIEVDLEPNITDTIQPVTIYKSDVEFFFVEDFETSNTLTVNLDTFGIFPVADSAGAFEGESANFTLTEANPIMEVLSTVRMEIPKERGETYLEINYKNEGFLQIGLMGYETGQLDGEGFSAYIFALNPKEEWNKTYIELTDDILNSAPGIVEFSVLIGAQHDSDLASTSYGIDNIKVLYRSTSN